MEYTIEKMSGFKVIGFEKTISMKNGYNECPKFWQEYSEKYMLPIMNGANAENESENETENEIRQAICDNGIGEFGVCIYIDEEYFKYMIAGKYNGGKVPEGMTVFEFPNMEWAKFTARGKIPEALQALNTEIFEHWMPENSEYDFAFGGNVEWYSKGDMNSDDYESGIWVPVKKK